MNVISKTLAVCLVLLLAAPVFAERNPQDRAGQTPTASIDFANWIDANRILMFVTNKGSFAFDNGSFFGKSDGLYFPFTSTDDIFSGANDLSCIYAGSIWMGGQVAAIDSTHPYWVANSATLAVDVGDTLVTSGQHDTDWGIGPILPSGMPAEGDADAVYRVYVLYKDSLADNPNQDYLDWPVDQGAPVDEFGNPKMLGDEMQWSVYNDLDIGKHVGSRGTTGRGLGIEVRQTAFAFAREGALGNIVFIRFRAYNKGPYDLENVFISLWSDPDLGDANDDYVGCDTLTSLGFCYNSKVDDANYGLTPPATGYDFFQGPLVPGDPSDTGIAFDFTKFPGMKNLGMVSFNRYVNPFGPDTPTDSYEFMNGLNKDGTPVMYEGEVTMYFNSGDPVTGEGFLDVSPDDTGPISMAQGDSVEVVAAVLCGRSSDYLASITELRAIDDFAQSVYDREFQLPSPPASPDVTVSSLDNQVILTWGTASEDDPGEYPFEGYAIFQGPSAGGPWVDTLAWFDITNGMGAVPDVRFDPLLAENVRYVAKPGTDAGLEHTWTTTMDHLTGGTLTNYKEYFYRVEAYSADTMRASGEHTLTSASIVSAMPLPPAVGTDYNSVTGQELEVIHAEGGSPGWAEAYIVDPTMGTGHDYKIVFTDFYIEIEYDTVTVEPLEIDTIEHTIEGWVWHVIDVTTGDSVVTNWSNQSDVEGNNYPVADGLLFRVYGPPPSLELFSVVANADGPIDPPESGAAPWADFPVPTEVDVDGYPTAGQQADTNMASGWLFHTADNGGTCGGGERYYFDHTLHPGEVAGFLSRATRDLANLSVIGAYEMRFTGDNASPGTNGGYAIEAFNDDNVFWVPFELWNIGIGTPNDPSDDVRLIPLIIDDGEDDMYALESWGCIDSANGHGDGEHVVSGGDNDPFTDWVYWYTPADMTPGDAGYQQIMDQWVTAGNIDSGYVFLVDEVFARTVLVSWNAGVEPPFGQDCPEQGTIFRITTAKPNTQVDVYTLSTDGSEPSAVSSGSAELLNGIKTVPNPYYLFSEYDPSARNHLMKFINLPEECTIDIYTLSGDLVETIEHSGGLEEFWDLENRFGIPVASGIYIYVVDAPGFGEKVGKMAIFTEVELLEQY